MSCRNWVQNEGCDMFHNGFAKVFQNVLGFVLEMGRQDLVGTVTGAVWRNH